jgi:hypothetical protein
MEIHIKMKMEMEIHSLGLNRRMPVMKRSPPHSLDCSCWAPLQGCRTPGSTCHSFTMEDIRHSFTSLTICAPLFLGFTMDSISAQQTHLRKSKELLNPKLCWFKALQVFMSQLVYVKPIAHPAVTMKHNCILFKCTPLRQQVALDQA